MSISDLDGLHMEKALEEHGEIMASVAGISMYPMLRHKKDMVVIKKVDRKFKVHDVPLYRLPSGKLVLHRILKITDNGYIIRGDNLYKKEYNITDDNIIGMLKAFYRKGKFFDCETNKLYKAYIILNRLSYPLRYAWKIIIWPTMVKVKRIFIKSKSER